MQDGWDQQKIDVSETINVKNPGPRDRLLVVRGCAEVFNGAREIENREQKLVASIALNEAESFYGEMLEDDQNNHQALIELESLMSVFSGRIARYCVCKKFVHCEVCKSSFLGEGPTDAEAFFDAKCSLSDHWEDHHADNKCSKCGHLDSDHLLAVCGICLCGVRPSAIGQRSDCRAVRANRWHLLRPAGC